MNHLRGAAAWGCGPVAFRALAVALVLATAPAAAGPEAQAVPDTGVLAAGTMQRVLLLDAERVGQRLVAVGDRGYIVYSDDQGKRWVRARSPAAPLLTAVDFVDDQLGLAVGHDAVILATRDRGETWSLAFSAPQEQRPLLDVLFMTPESAIAVGAYGAYYESGDGGHTWKARKVIEDDKHLNAILELGNGRLLILGEAGTILASGDAGKTWSPVASPYKGSFFGGVVANDGAVIAFGLRGRIFRSTDKGATWKPVENASVAALMGADKLADGTLVLAGGAGTVLASRDNGLTFARVQSGTTRAIGKPVAGGDGELLLLGEAGARTIPLAGGRATQ